MGRPSKRARRSSGENAYAGYQISRSGSPAIERLSSPPTPRAFFENFIAKRKPVVLTCAAAALGPSWRGSTKWSAAYLDAVVGAAPVRIEQRDTRTNPRAAFGRGHHSTMPFNTFQAKLRGGARDVYLTTQDIAVDEEGRPALVSTPCAELLAAGDFVLRPPLAGGLVLMNANLWYGSTGRRSRAQQQQQQLSGGSGGGGHVGSASAAASASASASTAHAGGLKMSGSSSGLHHDFHENLYVLLRGAKRFRLYSPVDALRLATVGTVRTVHPNGRIVYAEEGDGAMHKEDAVLGDGSSSAARAAMAASLARDAAESTIAAARVTIAEGVEVRGEVAVAAAQESLRVAEQAMEDALDAAMDAEMEWGDGDDFDDDEDGGGGRGGGSGSSTTAFGADTPSTSAVTVTPDNFSQIDLTLADDEVRSRWPMLEECATLSVTVHAGELLYLPAGWFHEVTSLGEKSSVEEVREVERKERGSGAVAEMEEAAEKTKEVEGAHMAFNYWFHPPDTTNFEAPYSSDFWEWEWAQRGEGHGPRPAFT